MSETASANKRVLWIDVARAIAIILVVCGHCDNFTTFSIQKFAGLFFMPLFIFISGYLFKDRALESFDDLKSFLKRRVWPIYKYYLTYEILFYVLTNLFFKIGFYSSSVMYGDKIIHPIASIPEFLIGIVKIVVLMGREPFCAAFWFFIALIFVTIGYSVIVYVAGRLKNRNLIHVGVLICFALGCIMRYTINIPRISPALTLILFYHLGNVTYTYRDRLQFNRLYLAALSLIGLLVLYNFGSLSMNKNVFPDPIFLILSSAFGIYFSFYISKVIDNKTDKLTNALAYIGQNTLPIIAFHIFCFKIVMLVQLYFGVITFDQLAILNGVNNNNLWYIAYVIVGVGVPLLINEAIEKAKSLVKLSI
jgi:fucose 4-O-acetylase-like acetyltransferase